MVTGLRRFSTLVVAGMLMACGGRAHSASQRRDEPGTHPAIGAGSTAVLANASAKYRMGPALEGSTTDPNREGGAQAFGAEGQRDSRGDPRPALDRAQTAMPGRSDADQQPAVAAAEATRLHLYVVAHLQRTVTNGKQPDGLANRVDWMKKLGFVGTRVGFEWPDIEPDQGDFQWSLMDTVVAASRAAGLRVYGLLLSTPAWARPPGTGSHERPILDGSAKRGDTAFAHFAAETARHFRGRVQAWEIWNEPNIKSFWSHVRNGRNQGPDPDDYLHLYRLARDSIHASVPDVMVMPAGLASGPRTLSAGVASHREAGGYPLASFLDALLRGGLKPSVVAIHPYTDRPPRLDAQGKPVNEYLSSVEDLLERYHLPNTHIWVTEWGIDARQAKEPGKLKMWYQDGLHALVCDPRVSVVTLYELVYMGGKARFGLLGREGKPTTNGVALDSVLEQWKTCR